MQGLKPKTPHHGFKPRGLRRAKALFVIEIALAQTGCLGVGMNVAQGVQGTLPVGDRKTGTVVALLPKVPAAMEDAVEAHSGVPVQPVHDLGQVFRPGRFQ